jgi:hypothetical protein
LGAAAADRSGLFVHLREERLAGSSAEGCWERRCHAELHDDAADAAPLPPKDRDDDSAEASSPTLANAAMALVERAVGLPGAAAADRLELFVHLREERLAGSSAEGSWERRWHAELHDGTLVSGDALLRLACDSGLVVAVTDDRGDVLDSGRRRRRVSAALRRALLVRDRQCRFPGCTQSALVGLLSAARLESPRTK